MSVWCLRCERRTPQVIDVMDLRAGRVQVCPWCADALEEQRIAWIRHRVHLQRARGYRVGDG